ncbi:DNA-binding protein [Candidatus Persebacteraceae bacterium Df01]|jgi:gp16 family phage-associated protein|uniref:DNA-binding protein n=1 Tax=Candidatus Doriopsillibacter californiensis TaxID=2970740 RepID=A0ABT7QLS2_9GAMM|nr:DNA-binding protein [Candidatus Persebacteraceae bacterium Df01]
MVISCEKTAKNGKAEKPYYSYEAAKERLKSAGVTYAAAAKKIGVAEHIINDLLNGRLAGNRGKCHKAAVALGIKRHIKINIRSVV